MKKHITKLIKQKANWDLAATHYFHNRRYEIDKEGNFYKDGILRVVKKDGKDNYWHALRNDKNQQVRFKIPQILMQTFFPDIIADGITVDHIDRVRTNNDITNLRFANRQTQYNNRDNRTYKIKKVLCLTTGVSYDSCQGAEIDLGLVKNTVSRVARGERKSIHGYSFKYLEDL